MAAILVIEDDPLQREAVSEYLESGMAGESHLVYAAADGELAKAVLSERSVDCILCDLMLPDTTGIEILRSLRSEGNQTPFLILTAQPTIETAVEAIQAGADDYLLKPIDLRQLRSRLDRLLQTQRLREENRQLRARLSDTFSVSGLIGQAPSLSQVLEKLRQVAPTEVTVLIEGESGSGKELIANLIHENSPRRSKPFIKVNCGALTKSILESELFGVVRGAFTGADRDRQGYFESANGGTIFLDEIGEMDLESQVRLLRVIEEREVVRIGSSDARRVDIRIVAATNRHLLNEVEDGRFREDLYYRLSVIRLHLPSLRERREDIPLLFNHFVTQFNDRYGKSVSRIAPELLQFFQAYEWPGNVRQFRNLLEGMVVLARDDTLQKSDLPPELLDAPRRSGHKLDAIAAGIPLVEYEQAIIAKNLAFTGGNRERAAKLLGISERTLYRKIKEYDL